MTSLKGFSDPDDLFLSGRNPQKTPTGEISRNPDLWRDDYSDEALYDFTRVDTDLYPKYYPPSLDSKAVRKRYVHADQKSEKYMGNIISAVTTLERWICAKCNQEKRVEEMHPTELETFFVEFVQILRRPSGEEYSSKALINFRTCIDKFLEGSGYHFSISRSPEFARSRGVIRAKRQWLDVYKQLSGKMA